MREGGKKRVKRVLVPRVLIYLLWATRKKRGRKKAHYDSYLKEGVWASQRSLELSSFS